MVVLRRKASLDAPRNSFTAFVARKYFYHNLQMRGQQQPATAMEERGGLRLASPQRGTLPMRQVDRVGG